MQIYEFIHIKTSINSYFQIKNHITMNEPLKRAIEDVKIKYSLKQSEIAERIGVKSTYLSDMINGRVPLTSNMVEKMYEQFQIEIATDGNEVSSSKRQVKDPKSKYIKYIKGDNPEDIKSEKDKIIVSLVRAIEEMNEVEKIRAQAYERTAKNIERLIELLNQ